MNASFSLRDNVSHTSLGAGIAATLGAFFPVDAGAQDADAISLSTIEVEASRGNEANALNAGTGLSRLPGRVQDIPQTINVVPQEVLEQQNVTTVEQALRNVPGVTLSVGEGNGGLNGDQFRIRGFQAKNDIYVDGLRDFGVYVRDSFNMEDVQVIKGPSSETFGLGTTGGVINSTSKRSFLGSLTAVDGTLGQGPLGRGTFDVNRQIDDTTAIRINGMIHDQDIVDRDNVKSDRWGLASSLGFGLGTDTTWFLNYFHQHTDRTPDYGVPTVQIPRTRRALPVTSSRRSALHLLRAVHGPGRGERRSPDLPSVHQGNGLADDHQRHAPVVLRSRLLDHGGHLRRCLRDGLLQRPKSLRRLQRRRRVVLLAECLGHPERHHGRREVQHRLPAA